jgi:hypothetical protein
MKENGSRQRFESVDELFFAKDFFGMGTTITDML